MPAKLILTWDILPGHEQEYFEFVVREFIPGVQKLGFNLTDAWATVFGRQPQIMVGAVSENRQRLDDLLQTSEWAALQVKLAGLIENYQQKIVIAKDGFQF
ncbi:MAG: hypothetical protein JW704_12790 [Anaerolineaceae bacterium]|nr:hypothetical protein [Anaerolineaceae bacterium]